LASSDVGVVPNNYKDSLDGRLDYRKASAITEQNKGGEEQI